MDIFLLLIAWLLCGTLTVLFVARWVPGIFAKDIGFAASLLFAGAIGLFVVSLVFGVDGWRALDHWLRDYGYKHSQR